MIELLTNTTGWAALIALAVCCGFWIRSRHTLGSPAIAVRAVHRCLQSTTAISVLWLGAIIGAGFALYMDYQVPRDVMQDIVSAEQFLNGASMYPSSMTSLIKADLERERAAFSLRRWVPGIGAKEDQSYRLLITEGWTQAHPPAMTLFIAPFVMALGVRGTLLAMNGLSLIAMVFTLNLLRTGLNPGMSRRTQAALLALVLGWFPVIYTLRNGQTGILLAALMTLAWFALRRGWPISAGLAIAAATCLKVYPALLLLPLLIRHRRAFVSAVVSIGIVVLAIARLAGFQCLVEYSGVAHSVMTEYKGYRENISLLSVLTDAFHAKGPAYGLPAVLYIALALCICAGMAWVSAKAAAWSSVDLEYAMYVSIIPALTPVSWAHYLVLLLLPLAVLGREVLPGRNVRWRNVFGFVLMCWVLCIPQPALYGAQIAIGGAGRTIVGEGAMLVLKALPLAAVCSLACWLAAAIIAAQKEAGAGSALRRACGGA